MQDRIGEDFTGIILSCTKYGFFVELDDLFIEGIVPIATLHDDRYFFRDTDRTIAGARNGQSSKSASTSTSSSTASTAPSAACSSPSSTTLPNHWQRRQEEAGISKRLSF